MKRSRPWRRFVPLTLLFVVVVGGLLLGQSNHQHPGMPRPGSRAPQTPVASDQSAVAIQIRNFDFFPRELTVPPGASVTWTNGDESPHQITVPGAKLKTDFVFKGQSAWLTFGEAGVYSYNCALHPNMKGAVEVTK